MDEESKKITGVKVIADYLGVTERTVYRWEKRDGLRLHRIAGKSGKSVYAYKNELNEFLEKDKRRHQQKRKFSTSLLILATVLVLVVLVVSLMILNNQIILKKFNPAHLRFINDQVEVLNKFRQPLWSYPFESHLEHPISSDLTKLVDIDSDGRNEIFGFRQHNKMEECIFTLYDDDGAIIWEQYPKMKYQYDGFLPESKFTPRNIQIHIEDNGKVNIVVVWNHSIWFPSIINSYNIEGEEIGHFTNPGSVGHARLWDVYSDGIPEIISICINNKLGGDGALIVLPLENYSGVAPPFDSCTASLPEYKLDLPEESKYIRFSKPPVLKRYLHKYVGMRILAIDDEFIHINVNYWKGSNFDSTTSPSVIYIFSSTLKLISITPTSDAENILPKMLNAENLGLTIKEVMDLCVSSILVRENNDWKPFLK